MPLDKAAGCAAAARPNVCLSLHGPGKARPALARRQPGRMREARKGKSETTLTSAQRDGKARGRPGCRQTNQCVKTGPSVTNFRASNIVLHFPRQTSSQQTRGWTLGVIAGGMPRLVCPDTRPLTKLSPRRLREPENAAMWRREWQASRTEAPGLPSSVHPRRFPMCPSCEPAALGRNSKVRVDFSGGSFLKQQRSIFGVFMRSGSRAAVRRADDSSDEAC